MKLSWLDPNALPAFPDTHKALSNPNGLLAAGGSLSPEWLLTAYNQGIFPWFNEGDPILWWTPSPRLVLYPHQFHISRNLRKILKRGDYRVSINKNFSAVIEACALPREQQADASSWITPVMFDAYEQLHHYGWAHSVEVWREQTLIGGLYGVALGKIFFGESMFSKASNGSKIAIAHLVEWLKHWQYKLVDCQVHSDHLRRLGAIEIDRLTFEQILQQNAGISPAALCEKNNGDKPRSTWQKQDITLQSSHWVQNQ
ncbi:MAG: leucyl/phenylalanyl-tRNA--protein transferase [Cellvibrionaceae bacterium]|jgi:leucyl/phenylalanyl-tRNA--protein transferase